MTFDLKYAIIKGRRRVGKPSCFQGKKTINIKKFFRRKRKMEGKKRVYLAVAQEKPVEGRRLWALKIIGDRNGVGFLQVHTSDIQKVEEVGDNVYRVLTRNSIYIIEIIS